MVHKFLSDLKKGDTVDCVYALNFKYCDIDRQILNPHVSANGNKYLILKICDRSSDRLASVLYFYKSSDDYNFILSSNRKRTKYVKIKGVCLSSVTDKYGVTISSNSIIPAGSESGIVFDTSNLYAFNINIKNALISNDGYSCNLAHTSIGEFQDSYSVIDIGTELEYERIFDSPYDSYQINVKIPDLDETYNVPAYLTPTLANLIDNGYKIKIKVIDIVKSEIEQSNAGLRVNIRAIYG